MNPSAGRFEATQPSVLFQTRILTHYRVRFHQAVRENLSQVGIRYRLVVGAPTSAEFKKNDLATLDWAESAPTRFWLGGRLVWLQPPRLDRNEIVVIGQENAILSNYWLQMQRPLGRRLAYFGHGRNFQADHPNSLAERFKRYWIDKVDWWFAYTQRSANIVADGGFPADRITVFNNAIDTSAIQSELTSISEADQSAVRAALLAGSHNVGVFIGGLYDRKRIDHLIESAIAVRRRVPDFELMIIGGGPDAPLVEAAAGRHPWIHAMGPRFGREKTLLASLGRVSLMPGLVGLGVLDSFAYGAPMVTTDLPYHSPEIDYLKDGVNGVIVRETDSVDAYAAAVERILLDDAWRDHLRAGAAEALETYTIEAMAQRFAEGVVKALGR